MVPRPAWPGALATAALFVAAGVVAASIASEPDAVGLQQIVAVAIIGLSLVPLVGFAGQLSLCQMSFAGIGAIVMAHHGQGGSVSGLVVATVVTRPGGRAGGAAHAAHLRHLPGAGHRGLRHAARPVDLRPAGLRDRLDDISIFGTGSVAVDALDVPGVGTQRARLVFLAAVFAVLYLRSWPSAGPRSASGCWP